jgi:hypothetical protein
MAACASRIPSGPLPHDRENGEQSPFFCPHSPAYPALDLLGMTGSRMKAGES